MINIKLITTTIVLMTLSACDSNFSFTNNKKFDVVECESCKWTFKTQNMKCTTFGSGGAGLQHITVSEKKAISFSKLTDGTSKVTESPGTDEKCFFNANGKFSFNCTSVSAIDVQMFQSDREFDGKNSYRSNFKWYVTVAGEPRLAEESKLICKLKG